MHGAQGVQRQSLARKGLGAEWKAWPSRATQQAGMPELVSSASSSERVHVGVLAWTHVGRSGRARQVSRWDTTVWLGLVELGSSATWSSLHLAQPVLACLVVHGSWRSWAFAELDLGQTSLGQAGLAPNNT